MLIAMQHHVCKCYMQCIPLSLFFRPYILVMVSVTTASLTGVMIKKANQVAEAPCEGSTLTEGHVVEHVLLINMRDLPCLPQLHTPLLIITSS